MLSEATSLHEVLAKMYHPLPCVSEVRIEGFRQLLSLPKCLSSLFPCATRVIIQNCRSFHRLSSAVFHDKIKRVTYMDCPSVTSLSSLESIPTGADLRSLAFVWCGLSTDEGDSWSAGFKALSQLSHNLDIEISHCDELSSLPSTIALLRESCCYEIKITLASNPNLKSLPPGLGDVAKLRRLTISNCPEIESLPWQLLRLNAYTSFELVNMPKLLTKLGLSGRVAVFRLFDKDLVTYLNKKKARQGALLLGAYIGTLRHKAIAPNGSAYKRAKISFDHCVKCCDRRCMPR